MTINYSLTADDYIDFNVYHNLNSDAYKKQFRILTVAFPLFIFVVVALYILLTGAKLVLIPIIIGISVAISWIIVFPWNMKRGIKRQVIKLLNQGDTSELIGNHSMTLTDDRIREENEYGKTDSIYSAVEKIVYDSNCIYIYNGANSAFLVPHKAFDSPEQEDLFVRTIRERAGIKSL